MNIRTDLPSAVVGGLAIAVALPAVLPAQAPPPPAAGDASHGGQLFLQCRACHVVAPDAPSTVGPNLAGIVGSRAGSRARYAYSPDMAKSGIIWTAATLDAFLKRPSAIVSGTKMAFAGVPDPRARADIIAYLATLKGR